MNSVPSIRKFLLGAVLLAAAMVGQLWLSRGAEMGGAVLLVLGALGFAAVLRRGRGSRRASAVPAINGWNSFDWWLPVAMVLGGLGLSLAAWVQLDVETPTSTVWRIYGTALLLSVAGPVALLLTERGKQSVGGLGLSKVVALVAVIAVAATLRLYRLEDLPFGFWYDEAANGLEALRVVSESDYHPLYTDGVNATGHYLFLIAAALEWFGVSMWSVRIVTAVMGIAATFAMYMAARELFGEPVGVLAAALFAVSRWALTFSRLGMYNIATPLFELLTIAFLLRAFRRNRLEDFALAGLSIGLGLCFYPAFQLFLPVVAMAAVLTLAASSPDADSSGEDHGRWRTRWSGLNQAASALREGVGRTWPGIIVMAACIVIVIAPVLKFAIEKPDLYFARVQGTSLFAEKEPGERLPALAANLRKHLLMFNVKGDPNGRHNLPGEPMLDPITGALFVTGIALSVVQWRRPHRLLLLFWLGMSLMGGVLSLDFEAPQSLRSIGALPAALLLAALPLHALNEEWRIGGGKYYPNAAVVGLALLLAPSAAMNIDTYFRRQANDFASWNAHSTPETLTAQILNSLAPGTRAYVISLYDQHPTVRFLTQNRVEYRPLDTTAALPLIVPADADLALILDAERRHLYEEAVRLYPSSAHSDLQAPFGSPTVLYSVVVPAEQIAAIQGLEGRYTAGAEESGQPALVRKDGTLDFLWPDDAPMQLPFHVEWRAVLVTESYGPYQFGLSAPSQAELYINEQVALSLEGEGQQAKEVALILPRGKHSLRVTANGAEGRIRLIWRTPDREAETIPSESLYVYPVTINGLLGRYFPNADWSGSPALAQIDTRFDMYFHIIPLNRPYTVEWTGKIAAPEFGVYGFGLSSVDESSLYIDGAQVVSSGGKGEYGYAPVELTEGLHDIRILYADRTDHSRIAVYWTPPGEIGRQIIPTAALFPPQADYANVALPSSSSLWGDSDSLDVGSAAAPSVASPARVLARGLTRPAGIAVWQDGRVAVALPEEHTVVILDADGALLAALTKGDEQFLEPFDVDVDKHGTLYVLDSGTGRVSEFDSELAFARTAPIQPEYAERARGIDVGGDGLLWIADTAGGTAVGFDASGALVQSYNLRRDLASAGEAQPVDVVRLADATVWVSDAGVHRLTAYSAAGIRLRSFDIPVANTRDGPHLAAGPDGDLYVTEPEQRSVARYEAGGTLIARYQIDVGDGTAVKPVGIDVDADGNIWMSDVEGGRVLHLEMGVER